MKTWKKVLIIGSLCTLAGAFTALGAPGYENIAVSRVSGSVNIRTEANTSSTVVGKINNDCAAEILETVEGEGGQWYKIRSGSRCKSKRGGAHLRHHKRRDDCTSAGNS